MPGMLEGSGSFRWACLLFAFCCVADVPAQQAPADKAGPSEELIVQAADTVGKDAVATSAIVSPDRRRVAWTIRRGRQHGMLLDGKDAGTYDEVLWWHFTPDSQHFIFVGRRGKQRSVLVDGVQQFTADDVSGPVLSKDKSRLAYHVTTGPTSRVILDGTAGPDYDDIRQLTLSQDGSHVVYAAKRRHLYVVVFDGQEQTAEYDEIESVRLCPNGKHLAYTAKRGIKWMAVLDGRQQAAEHDEIRRFTLSPDGERLAYTARHGEKWVAVVDGQQHAGEYDEIDKLAFSQDGKHLAYAGKFRDRISGDKWVVVLDGKEGPKFNLVSAVIFGQDGQHHAYTGANNGGSWNIAKEQHGNGRIVLDGTEGPVFRGGMLVEGLQNLIGYTPKVQFAISPDGCGVSAPIMSPDGKRLAYVARTKAARYAVVVDGEVGPEYEQLVGSPRFSPDSRHVVYFAAGKDTAIELRDGKIVREIPSKRPEVDRLSFSADGQRMAFVVESTGLTWSGLQRRRVLIEGPEPKDFQFESVSVDTPIFSSGGRHVAVLFTGTRGRKSVVTIDGVAGKPYDSVVSATLAFASDNVLTYVAQEGLRFYRVTQMLP